MRDITVANAQSHGLRVGIIINDVDGTEFLEGGQHVQISFAKVMSNCLFCVCDDLSDLFATGMDNTTGPNPGTVAEVNRPQR